MKRGHSSAELARVAATVFLGFWALSITLGRVSKLQV